jgi:argininosuccinate lyase
MRRAAFEGFSTATDLADYLVKKGLPFRDAHESVAHAVKDAAALGKDLSELTLEQLQAYNPTIESDIFQVLTLEGSVNARNHIGGTAPAQVRLAIAAAQQRLAVTI